ncbi:MAG TPA: hypothetical protein VNV82_01610 [Bryobacteraceae bacterium]|jgi:hypothetical protein|nr:hypothetical protein [Bryobacteraceae bacterium]
MQKHQELRKFAAVLLPLASLVSSLAAAEPSLQAEMNAVLKKDPRNGGIAVSVEYRSNASVLFYDLRAVAATNSMADVFRVFLQFAQIEKSRQFESVKLAFRGQPRFGISGKYFKQLGEQFGTENAVYMLRTFPENLLRPDGSHAYPTWTGGWLGVAGKQTEDFNDFHRQWWLNDFIASATPGAAPQLEPVSAASASTTGPPVTSPSSRIVSEPNGEEAGKSTPVAASVVVASSSSQSEQFELPAWIVIFPGSADYVKTATHAEVTIDYKAHASAPAVVGFYEEQFRKTDVTARESFNGIGTTIQTSAAGKSCVLRIREADADTDVNVKCAVTPISPAEAVSLQPTPLETSSSTGGIQRSEYASSQLTSARRPPPGVHHVEYSVDGSARTAGLTYRNATGGTEQNEVSLPKTFSFYATGGSFVYLSAQNKTGTGYVHVSITIDGRPLQEAAAGSAYGIATANGIVPR